MPWQKFLNMDGLRRLTDGDREIEKQFVTMFMETAQDCIDQLAPLVEHDAHNQWPGIVHALKGAAANIYAESMIALCQDAEKLENAASRREAFAQIKAELARYEAVLKVSPR
jgi:HPt (histidine-containing phosphotransfer) domain-containing protein